MMRLSRKRLSDKMTPEFRPASGDLRFTHVRVHDMLR
jgi:hypothetical protein